MELKIFLSYSLLLSMWRAENNLWELVLSLHCVGPGDRTQVARFGGTHVLPIESARQPHCWTSCFRYWHWMARGSTGFSLLRFSVVHVLKCFYEYTEYIKMPVNPRLSPLISGGGVGGVGGCLCMPSCVKVWGQLGQLCSLFFPPLHEFRLLGPTPLSTEAFCRPPHLY